MMQVGALSFVPISQEISDRKVGQVSEGFGSILSTLTNPEKNPPENRNLDGDGKGLEGENLPILKEELQQLIQLLNESEESDWANFVMNSQSLNLDGDLTLLVEENFETLDLPSMVSTLLKSVNPEKDGLDSSYYWKKSKTLRPICLK